jgi:hypothetical protein
MKTENFQISHEEGHIPRSSLVKTSHKIFEDPQNEKKEIENFETSKYQKKRPSKFAKEKQIVPPLRNFTQIFLNTPKMTRRKLKISKLQNTRTKNTIFF